MAFMGRKMLKPSIFIATTLLMTGVILMVCYAIFLNSAKDYVVWCFISLAIVVAFGFGFLSMRFQMAGGILISAYGGFMVAVLINLSVLYIADSKMLMLVVNLMFSFLAAALGYFFFN